MSTGHYAHLEDRSVLSIAGDDARSFLQGLITNDIEKVSPDSALYAALLTPQGKILFDFFICARGDGFLIDCAAPRLAELRKRLTFYKLRAAVDIEDVSETYNVTAFWGDTGALGLAAEAGSARAVDGGTVHVDPRTAALGARAILERGSAQALAEAHGFAAAGLEDYHGHRIANGVADSEQDIGSGEHFPHETNLDQLNGVDFKKGCYVGQEVVSRTQHRATARKRIVPVTLDGAAPPAGTSVDSGGRSIGSMLSGTDGRAIALIRLDRAASAQDGDIVADGRVLRLGQPEWAQFEVPGAAEPAQ